ncbi:MAG: hypothetical protein NTAFB09_17660 [Nitrosospira sp.]
MSLQSTKEHLIQLLTDQDNKVIALSGRWGTGKSHLWREVKKASQDEAVQSALDVSLFGLSGMNQIKLKIMQMALPSAEKHSAAWKQVGVAMDGIRKVLSSVHRGFSSLDDLVLLAVPTVLKDKIIVLDDIERKHEKLSIDEILGFIDEFTQQYGARFILILNSDQLANREVWDVLREKVVDQEIRLDISSSEAFEVAVGLTSSPYAEQIQSTVEICGLTNIRIIRKVIKATNRILGDRENLSEAVLSRVIPSTVLLAAINYKGIDDGPDFDFVLAQGTLRDWIISADNDEEQNEQGKLRAKWKLLLNELGIHGCDDYERLVIEFLQSGLFDVGDVAAIIDRYIAETDAMNARDETRRFLQRVVWDHRITEVELLEEAKALALKSYLLDPYNVTSLYEAVSQLPGGMPLADAIMARWVEVFKAKNVEDLNNDDDDNSFNHPIHFLIKAEFDAIKARAQAKTKVFDTCVDIAKNSGWSARQEMAMRAASVADFELTIKTVDIQGLQIFMHQMLKMRIRKQTYEPHFGAAMDRFVEACHNIAQDPQSGRLGKLIKGLFADMKLGALLNPSTATEEALSATSAKPSKRE